MSANYMKDIIEKTKKGAKESKGSADDEWLKKLKEESSKEKEAVLPAEKKEVETDEKKAAEKTSGSDNKKEKFAEELRKIKAAEEKKDKSSKEELPDDDVFEDRLASIRQKLKASLDAEYSSDEKSPQKKTSAEKKPDDKETDEEIEEIQDVEIPPAPTQIPPEPAKPATEPAPEPKVKESEPVPEPEVKEAQQIPSPKTVENALAKKEEDALPGPQSSEEFKDPSSFPAPQRSSEELSEAEREVASGERIELESYGNVKIYRVPGQKLLYYFVPVPKSTESEKRIIRIIREAATRLITIEPYKIRDAEQRRAVYKQKIRDILDSSPEVNIPNGKIPFYTEAVVREMVGYGLIDELVKDDKLEEIMIIGPKKPVYVFHRDYEMMKTNIEFFSEGEIVDLINKIAREIGRRVDFSSPLLDSRMPDGSRVNATIPPASISGPTLTIRKFREDPFSIVDMINFKTISPELAAFLWVAVEGLNTRPANFLISGGTGSGKTSLLNVLTTFIPTSERVLTIEDTAELNLPLEHWVRFEARPPGLEGRGELALDVLTKNSLRMRPDRIIVGEIRHKEAFSLFTAMNTGHDGSMGTVHANSAQETLIRVTSPPMEVPNVMLSGLNFIVVEHRLHDKRKGTIRRVTEVAEVSGVLEGKPQTEAIFSWNPEKDAVERTNMPCAYIKELARLSGSNVQKVEKEIKRRQEFLEKLVKKKERDVEKTSQAMQDFLD